MTYKPVPPCDSITQSSKGERVYFSLKRKKMSRYISTHPSRMIILHF